MPSDVSPVRLEEDAQQKHRYPSDPTQSPCRCCFREIPFGRSGVHHQERCLLSLYPSIYCLFAEKTPVYRSQLVWSLTQMVRLPQGGSSSLSVNSGTALLVPDECSTEGSSNMSPTFRPIHTVGAYVSQMHPKCGNGGYLAALRHSS